LAAYLNDRDGHHRRTVAFMRDFGGSLIVTWPILTEVCHLIPQRLVNRFMRWAAAGGVVVFELPPSALSEVAALMHKHADRPMDLADASLVWLAGQIGLTDVITVDDADFATYRTATGKAFRNLLPVRAT
jgi:predicted nucleic acid-binding protein